MNTKEHLEKIKAKCQELLATAEKRTEGIWRHNEINDVRITALAMHQNPVLSGNDIELTCFDGDFIASCAGPAEAGWRATIAAIDVLQKSWLEGSIHYGTGRKALETIVTAWPEELLN